MVNMSACNMEDHFSTVYYWARDVWEDRFLRTSYCLVFLTNFLPRWFLTLCIYIANLFVSFTSVNKIRYEKAIGSAAGFYCSQRVGWMIAWMIILCLQSLWEIPLTGKQYGNKKSPKNSPKEKKHFKLR